MRSPETEIRLVVARVREAPSLQLRIAEAQKLVPAVESASPGPIDAATIAEIASLLGDDSDIVRAMVAAALGFAGSSATPALPALRRALEHPDLHPPPTFFDVQNTSEDVIRLAIDRIEGRAPVPPAR